MSSGGTATFRAVHECHRENQVLGLCRSFTNGKILIRSLFSSFHIARVPACISVSLGYGTLRLNERSCSRRALPWTYCTVPQIASSAAKKASSNLLSVTGGVIQLRTAGLRGDLLRRGSSCLEGHRPAHSPSLGLRARPAESSRRASPLAPWTFAFLRNVSLASEAPPCAR